MGYTGGRTILLDYLRKIRGASRAPRKIFRRFETAPAEEMQADWSPFRTIIAGREMLLHCFLMILCYSRYLFIQFYRNERLPSLLAAHVAAFEFFNGVARRSVYDNMATITFGRRGREILWNPEFLKFTQHYMYEPVLCRPRDPNRKGKGENPFLYVENDFLKGRSFTSLDHLEEARLKWLKEVANRRIHGTTRMVPEEAWKIEREFLTALPETPFPTYREEIRSVYEDGLIAVNGTRYSVPALQLGTTATVRVYPRSIEILNKEGRIVATHRKPDFPGGVIINKEHYCAIRRKPRQTPGETERRFLARFPDAEDFLKGLKVRMKSLYRLHLVEILRLAQLYGDGATAEAISRATRYGNFNAYSVRRILHGRFPLISPDVPPDDILPTLAAQPGIADVQMGSFQDYQQYSQGDQEDPRQDGKEAQGETQ